MKSLLYSFRINYSRLYCVYSEIFRIILFIKIASYARKPYTKLDKRLGNCIELKNIKGGMKIFRLSKSKIKNR